jgi:hydroxyethylthiazole kinase-like uncharacterized protein yjeF
MKLKRDKHGHKGTFGTVLVIGGSYNELVMFGGTVLAAKACLRTGAGKVIVALPKELAVGAITLLPEAIAFPINESQIDLVALNKQIKAVDIIVVGPGWSEADYQTEVLEFVLKEQKPTIIDAGALNTIAENSKITELVHNKCILTPHTGELNRLKTALECSSAQDISIKTGSIVVHKSSTTELTDGKKSWTLNKPNSALATAGSGDVLAGMIGGLVAQYSSSYELFDIAKTAINMHSKAGAQLRPGALASEIIDKIVI